jgi:hypothetical protein
MPFFFDYETGISPFLSVVVTCARVCTSPFVSGWATSEVAVYGRGENPARQQPALTTVTPAGAVSSLEAWPWPKLRLPISGAEGNPRSGSPVRAMVAPRRRSLLEDVVLVTRGVLSWAASMGDVMVPGVGCHLERRLQGCNVRHGGCTIVVGFPKTDWILPSTCRLPLGV